MGTRNFFGNLFFARKLNSMRLFIDPSQNEVAHMSDKKIQKPEQISDDVLARRERRARGKKIGDKLRAMYDDVANEPVPDEFLKLLEDADDASEDQGIR